MSGLEGQKERADFSNVNDLVETEGKRVVSRNILAKKQMAEQLIAMGLSKESVVRLLHFD